MSNGRFLGLLALALLSVAACGDDDAAAREPDASHPSRDAGSVRDAGSADAGPAPLGECEGFRLQGLLYSPGGDVLPNTCKPFDPTTNNPYAVRCVDAWPDYHTRFPGDNLCILPPPPERGIQVGFHPQGKAWFEQVSAGDLSGYDGELPEHWVLPPGGEETINFRTGAENPEAHAYYRTYFRMRTGSHHSIITLHEGGAEQEVWLPGQELPGLFDTSSGKIIGVLGGEQRPDDSTPVTLEKPEEDRGMYLEWPAQPTILFNLHHFNVTDADVLKESWVNIWWEDEREIKASWFMGLDLTQVGGLSVAPGETVDLHYAWTAKGATRLVRLFGHRHAWTTNFSSWIERASGDVELVYQSFDWSDMPTYRYDSHVQNPMPSVDSHTDGAASGLVNLAEGDRLHFNCHIAYTDERAASEHAPLPSEIGTLRFANEVFRGEMCIAFGNTSGDGLGDPKPDTTALPDFAAQE
jgi:hypothetical protein